MGDYLLSNLVDFYQYVQSRKDKRVVNWPLTQSPFPTLAIVGLYCLFLVLGPRVMVKRKPLVLREVLIVYNFVNVFLSLYIFVTLGVHGLFGKYSLKCQPVDYTGSVDGLGALWGGYVYFLVKIFDLLDTVFFILRKKNDQVTFLHVVHHMTMPINGYFCSGYTGGGHAALAPFLNSAVHVLMYF